MTQFVVDASVAVKWCLPAHDESLVTEAGELLATYRREKVAFIVPDLFWVELGNALWKAARRKVILPEKASSAIAFVQDLDIPTISSFNLMSDALDIAARYDCTVYDSLYVALAVETQSELITADERLANALAARLPVKWLGAI